MSTRKSLVFYVYMKFRWVRWPMLMPVRVIWELLDAIDDVLLFTGYRIGRRDVGRALRSVSDALSEVVQLGSYELVEVKAGKRVCIKIGLW